MTFFGPGGIRGIINRDLTPEAALRLGRALGRTYSNGAIAIADDARDSAPAFKAAIVAGITASGTDAVDLGILPTPGLQHYVSTHPRVSGGVMITASHNPVEYNGIKLIQSGGVEAFREDEQAVADYAQRDVPGASWSSVGDTRAEIGAVDDYVDAIIASVDADSIRKAGLTACIDCANGAASMTTPLILAKLNVRAVSLECDVSNSARRESNPEPDNLTDLRTIVPALGADLGVAHDVDGSRASFIDASGRFIDGDIVGAFVAKDIVSDEQEVVTPLSSSRTLQDTVESVGGTVAYTPVGTHSVVRRILDDQAVLGVEEDGGLILPSFQTCKDGGMAVAKVLELIAKNGPLADQVATLPRYFKVKLTVDCPDELKDRVMDGFRMDLDGKDLKVDSTDGYRIAYRDGWILIRASATEARIRIYSESADQEKAETRAKEAYGKAVNFIQDAESGQVSRGSSRGPRRPR